MIFNDQVAHLPVYEVNKGNDDYEDGTGEKG